MLRRLLPYLRARMTIRPPRRTEILRPLDEPRSWADPSETEAVQGELLPAEEAQDRAPTVPAKVVEEYAVAEDGRAHTTWICVVGAGAQAREYALLPMSPSDPPEAGSRARVRLGFTLTSLAIGR